MQQVSSQKSNTCSVCRYTTRVPEYTAVPLDTQTQDVLNWM